jgi:hypothetical protein
MPLAVPDTVTVRPCHSGCLPVPACAVQRFYFKLSFFLAILAPQHRQAQFLRLRFHLPQAPPTESWSSPGHANVAFTMVRGSPPAAISCA